ncbi:hypothetical protein [Streptomyces nodosus]|uniref:hypothetical protein n=1 Tax=Streptomyces nodosus TaxID=40318 RepID=UPI0038133AAE
MHRAPPPYVWIRRLWHAIRARKQSADITRHRDRYAAGLQALRTYRANVIEVLRKLG